MKKNKAVLFTVVMAAALLFLSACSGGGGTEPEDLASTEPKEATETVENLETAIQDNDAASLAANISEKGVTTDIMGVKKTYQKSETEDLIAQIESKTELQLFNIVNRNTEKVSASSEQDAEEMVITGDLVETVSPFSNSQTGGTAAVNTFQAQSAPENFEVEIPDTWFKYYSDNLSSIEAYSAYSSLKNEGLAVLYFPKADVKDSELEPAAELAVQELKDQTAEMGELGVHNFKVKRTSSTTIDNQKAVRIESSYDSEYKLYKIVVVYQVIDGTPIILEIRIEGVDQVKDTIAREDSVYFVNAKGKLALVEYAADTDIYNPSRLDDLINSIRFK